MWAEQEDGHPRVRHSFYEKPITSPLVFHGRGACATRQKIVTLAEEIKRRMLNMDPLHSKEERIEIILKFSQKMVDSMYVPETRREILTSGITRYYRLVLQELAGKRSLYMSTEELKGGRERKSLMAKTWYKTQRGGCRVSQEKNFPEARVLLVSPDGKQKPRPGSKQSKMKPGPTDEETRETERMVRVV